MRGVIALALVLASGAASAQTAPTPDVIVTTGEAVVRRAPDVAFITVAVETRAKSPRDAQRQNADSMTAVQQRLTQARVPNDAVRTQGYTIQQEFDFSGGKRVPRDFTAHNSVEIRVDDVTRVGELMDAVVQGGATSIAGVKFDLADRSGAEREALRLAVLDARTRADAAAGGAGRSLDRIIRVEDVRQVGIAAPRPMMEAVSVTGAATTPIEPGLLEIRARVTLTAAMR